ncbi:hypothetical protein K458DRAFT_156597 [Lentithecium fluviatile CBS 122367]|uniref:Uncharacterized protein n=1 Tax=Lentithecium fluviatile CBS 122367 TaxID=1168545 RepID=A0A6G1IIA7_9PLEO|nr:hypothetical protein K458DRAFT_156597 [Lentithecium fluviatile CBS 122367]
MPGAHSLLFTELSAPLPANQPHHTTQGDPPVPRRNCYDLRTLGRASQHICRSSGVFGAASRSEPDFPRQGLPFASHRRRAIPRSHGRRGRRVHLTCRVRIPNLRGTRFLPLCAATIPEGLHQTRGPPPQVHSRATQRGCDPQHVVAICHV